MFHQIVQEFREVIRLVVGEAGGKMLQEALRSGVGEGGKIVAERIRTLVQENPRADLLFALLDMEPSQWDKIKVLHKKKLAGGEENLFILALGRALPRTADGRVDTEAAQRVLGQLNALNEDDLEQMLEFLHHDPIAQWWRYYVLGKGRAMVIATAESVAEVVGRALGELDRFAERDRPSVQRNIRAAQDRVRAKLAGRRSRVAEQKGDRPQFGVREFERRFMGPRGEDL